MKKQEVPVKIDKTTLYARALLSKVDEKGKVVKDQDGNPERRTKQEVVDELLKSGITKNKSWAGRAYDEMVKKIEEVDKDEIAEKKAHEAEENKTP